MRVIVFVGLGSALKHQRGKHVKIKQNDGHLTDHRKKGDFTCGAVHHKAKKAHNDLIEKGFYHQAGVSCKPSHKNYPFKINCILLLTPTQK